MFFGGVGWVYEVYGDNDNFRLGFGRNVGDKGECVVVKFLV